MTNSERYVYPAFIQQDDEGMFEVYFPTLFPEAGWDYPLSRGETKRKAIKNAEKDLAYTLAGILYDNEELPEPVPIESKQLMEGMELIEIETSFEPYAGEIQEQLKGRHWHIGYYIEETEEYMEAIGFKNEHGMWDIFFEEFEGDSSAGVQDPPLLFTVTSHIEAEEKFKRFVEEVLLYRRGKLEED
jgi:predicted RNase H-like HicB family nuclease